MLTELREGVWWYECTGVNAYLVADGDGVTVVDTGTPFDAATVEDAVEAAGFGLGAVDRVLLTHYDLDHVGAAAKLAVDAPVYAGRDDAPFVAGERRPRLAGGKSLLQLTVGPLVPDVPGDRVHPVADGDEVGGFTAYHTPGHTPGHVAYVHEDRGVERRPGVDDGDAVAVGDEVRVDAGALVPPHPLAELGQHTDDTAGSYKSRAKSAPGQGRGAAFCSAVSATLPP